MKKTKNISVSCWECELVQSLGKLCVVSTKAGHIIPDSPVHLLSSYSAYMLFVLVHKRHGQKCS